MTSVEIPIRRGRCGSRVVLDAAHERSEVGARPPIVARTLALAHKMQAMIDAGEVADQAELARVFGFTRARISQIMDLTLLAPGIQAEILFAEETDRRDILGERDLRKIVRSMAWSEQCSRWRAVRPAVA